MRRLLVLVALSFSGCQTLGSVFPAEDVLHTGNMHTLSYETGAWASEAYNESYKQAAIKACGSDNYKVIEKSAEPATLKDVPGLKAHWKFFWVVECSAPAPAH